VVVKGEGRLHVQLQQMQRMTMNMAKGPIGRKLRELIRSGGYNGCIRMAAEACRFLAEHPRPDGGQSRFNSEHLHQIASEIDYTLKDHKDAEGEDEVQKLREAMHRMGAYMTQFDLGKHEGGEDAVVKNWIEGLEKTMRLLLRGSFYGMDDLPEDEKRRIQDIIDRRGGKSKLTRYP
jgi:hypothetical protein